MKWLRRLLRANVTVLVFVSVMSFITHNVADAIFFMVVAVFIQNGLIGWGTKHEVT